VALRWGPGVLRSYVSGFRDLLGPERRVLSLVSCCRIVQEVNQSIGQDPNSMARIGVLDIYGFEHFKNNRCVAPSHVLY